MRSRSAVVLTAVLLLAGCSSGDDDTAAPPATGDGTLTVSATEMKFTPDEITVPAGPLTITLQNEGSIQHDLVIPEITFVEAAPGQSETEEVEVEPGTYAFYCSVPGHRNAGMEGVLEVEG